MKFSIKDFFSKFDQICSFLQICRHLLNKSLKRSSHRAILFWRQKLKLSPLSFSGDSDIFKAIFLYHPINFYRQLIPTRLILSPNLEEKILSWTFVIQAFNCITVFLVMLKNVSLKLEGLHWFSERKQNYFAVFLYAQNFCYRVVFRSKIMSCQPAFSIAS